MFKKENYCELLLQCLKLHEEIDKVQVTFCVDIRKKKEKKKSYSVFDFFFKKELNLIGI